MASLSTFAAPPPDGHVTICERDGELHTTLDPSRLVDPNLNYPNVHVTPDMMRPSLNKQSARSAFIEHNETLWKRMMHAWYDHGVAGVLETLTSSNSNQTTAQIASKMLACVRWFNSLHGSLFPHLSMSNEDMIANFSKNSDWFNCPVRAFAWHPHTVKYAVCLCDDSIKVYSNKTEIIPTLKHRLQKSVTALAWKPLSASVLAVACQTCILIWHVDPMSLSTRPSTSSVQVLSQSGHCPVTSIAWDPKGGILVSASAADTAMMVWDVAMETCIPLRRFGGGGVSLIEWSPCGEKILAATPSSMFRVWDYQTWSCEHWSKLAGICQAACWSPDGTILLFATSEEPVIYSLNFSTQPDGTSPVIGGSKLALASIDLQEVELNNGITKTRVGGLVQSLAWDPTGERLAVQFKAGQPGAGLIALFRTKISHTLEIVPCDFVQGQPGEKACLISFQNEFPHHGALLTVVWSSGRVGFVPLYFIPSLNVPRNLRILQSPGNGSTLARTLYSAPQT